MLAVLAKRNAKALGLRIQAPLSLALFYFPSPEIMNKTDDKLASLLDFIESSLKSTKAFAAEQAPDVVKEILRYGVWTNAFQIVVASLFVAISITFAFWCGGNMEGTWDNDAWIFGVIVSIVVTFIFVFWWAACLDELVKIKLAPKIYILEEAKGLLSSEE